MDQLTKLHQMVGRTIASVKETKLGEYEAIVLTFTDDTTAILVGGGYDGYGDYIRLEVEDRTQPPI